MSKQSEKRLHISDKPRFQPLREVRCMACGCINFWQTKATALGSVNGWCCRCQKTTNQTVR